MNIVLNRFIPAAAISFLIISSGCATTHKTPAFGQLYNRSTMQDELSRNPVIVIPGILGSRLKDSKTGRLVWGAFGGEAANPRHAEDARLIALPMREGVPLHELQDEVVSNGALDRVKVRLFFLPFRLNAYYQILRTLGIGGYRDEQIGSSREVHYGEAHFTCFQFDYDWRRDIVESAKKLGEFILEKRKYVQAEIERRFGVKNADIRFDIVAHSMGGLVARYYLQYGSSDLPSDGSRPPVTWEGARYIDNVVFVGTPNAGSTESLIQLVKGFKLGPFLPKYEPAILGTMPAIYELLPRPRHGVVVDLSDPEHSKLDIYDPGLWEEMNWGLVSPKQDRVLKVLLSEVKDPAIRRRIALNHLKKSLSRAKQFSEALDVPAIPPAGLGLYLFSGNAVPTASVLGVNTKDGTIKVIQESPGDGTVTRTSALMDERITGQWSPRLMSPIGWSDVIFLFTDHLGMTKDPAFTDNILFFLLEKPRSKAGSSQTLSKAS